MNELTAIIKNNIPFKKHLRALKRAIIPYQSDPKNDEALLAQAMQIVEALDGAGANLDGRSVVEIGTGWVPILPLVLRMAGASEVITVDQERLMDKTTFIHAVTYIRANMLRLRDKIGNSSTFNHWRLPSRHVETLGELCRSAGIRYLAPADFMELKAETADIIVSRTVLEHIPEDTLNNIFQHAARVLRPGGIMCHLIDMSDHFEHTDKSLSRVDMLRYSDKDWRVRTRDPQFFQNRLRRFDFRRIFEDTGWEIVSMTGDPHPKALEDLKTMNIMARYAGVPHEELAILTSQIVAKRKAD